MPAEITILQSAGKAPGPSSSPSCPVCARLASNLPPSLLELVDALEAKDGGRREIIAIAVFLGWMAGMVEREG